MQLLVPPGFWARRLPQAPPPNSLFSGDIRDADQVFRWMSGLGDVDAVLHLAALVPKQIVDQDTTIAFDTNVGGTLNVLQALRRMAALGQKAPWLFYASSSHVYAPSSLPIGEEALRNPFTLYGLTKWQGEQWCEAYARDFGVRICIGRIFSFSGPQQPDFYFLPAMFRKIREADHGVTLTIPGVQGYRDFLRVPQICRTIEALAAQRYEGSVNIGTGQAHKLSDIVLKVADRLGRSDLHFDFPDGSTEALVADNTRLNRLGISVACELDSLIDDLARA